MKFVILTLTLTLLALATSTPFQFQIGQEFSYSLSSVARPFSNVASSSAAGHLSGTVEVQVTQILDNGNSRPLHLPLALTCRGLHFHHEHI